MTIRNVNVEGYGGEIQSVERSDEGFAVSVAGLPGCHSQGVTEDEALENITDAIQEHLEVVAELNRDKVVREVEVEV